MLNLFHYLLDDEFLDQQNYMLLLLDNHDLLELRVPDLQFVDYVLLILFLKLYLRY